jgi:hypothetical protein
VVIDGDFFLTSGSDPELRYMKYTLWNLETLEPIAHSRQYEQIDHLAIEKTAAETHSIAVASMGRITIHKITKLYEIEIKNKLKKLQEQKPDDEAPTEAVSQIDELVAYN